MSIFGSIVDSIVSSAEQAVGITPAAAATTETPDSSGDSSGSGQQTATQSSSPGGGTTAPLSAINIEDVLSKKAAEHGGDLNYQSSIVDLLRVLGLNSSLEARKELANELNVHVGDAGTAEENMALHQAVMTELENNGGTVPDSLKNG